MSETSPTSAVTSLRRSQSFIRAIRNVDSSIRDYYCNPEGCSEMTKKNTADVLDFLFTVCGPARDNILHAAQHGSADESLRGMHGVDAVVEAERKMERAFRAYQDHFPPTIWDCCKRCCFATLATDSRQSVLFDEIMRIQEVSRVLHDRIGNVAEFIEERKRGVGGSTMAFVMKTRSERDPEWMTSRRAAISQLADFINDHLPFLYGMKDSYSGVPRPVQKLCTEAICAIFGVSRNFLYRRSRSALRNSVLSSPADQEEIVTSILDFSGVRMRQNRRIGLRTGYPDLDKLYIFDCGCSEPCFANAPLLRLYEWYKDFSTIAQQLKPRRKENRFLLNVMYCPLMNSTVNICNKALSALFTVSEPVIGDIRCVLRRICDDPFIEARAAVEERESPYKTTPRHPMNRLPRVVRDKVEQYLDLILRADPGASGGVNVCRVYSHEVNTQEKLRKVLAKHLRDDEIVEEPLSSSTLQRMINEYLTERKCEISFAQSDHNACPSCKTLQYAMLQFNREKKLLAARKESLEASGTDEGAEYEKVKSDLAGKEYQERTSVAELREHCQRDANIRGFLKQLADHFREVEREYSATGDGPCGWRQRHDHALITHQDDMTKVDLPSFVKTTTSDITRWRYDVNAHVSAVTGDCVVFSHEQGSGSKTASSIIELILLDHILRCRGEGIKVVVSDNAAVGKNWLTTIALPQYMVDQGLADIVLIVFLENNHGKWLADMLFGQLQIRRKRSTIVGIDALLAEFEEINKRNGKVRGFAVNPLSSVDFSKIFESLGYRVTPPKDFGFVRRDIHFAAACAPGAQSRLPHATRRLFGEMLPNEPGVVRINRGPPSKLRQQYLPFESRYVDVPAAAAPQREGEETTQKLETVPFVVPLDMQYAPSGPGLVSTRNMLKVGYNGFEFRKYSGYEELRSEESIVMEAWPPGLLKPTAPDTNTTIDFEFEGRKCAPENWIVRQPVCHFNSPEGGPVARYPPRNMLNAKYKRGPRCMEPWVPFRTYSEPPVPFGFWNNTFKTAASNALQQFAELHQHPQVTLSVLDLLRAIYAEMGERQSAHDEWLQNSVTVASTAAFSRYHSHVELSLQRERGHPRQPKTVRSVFKSDDAVRRRVGEIRNSSPERSSAQILNELFEEACITPGALDKFEYEVERDLERYAKELKFFKEVTQRSFDEERGLTPLPQPEDPS